MDCCKHTAALIHINEPNLYDENLMPTICDSPPSEYQSGQLEEDQECRGVWAGCRCVANGRKNPPQMVLARRKMQQDVSSPGNMVT